MCIPSKRLLPCNSIAGRKTGGRIEGDILVNGFPKVQETFARVMGYVSSPISTLPLRNDRPCAASARMHCPANIAADSLPLFPAPNRWSRRMCTRRS